MLSYLLPSSVVSRLVGERMSSLKSAREQLPPKKTPPPKKKPPESLKHQLRNFSPWLNRFGCSVFRRLSSGNDVGDVAFCAESIFVLIGGLSKTSTEEDTVETTDALFGKLLPNLDKLAKEMAKLADDQTSYKWLGVTICFLPVGRRVEKWFADKMETK